MNSFELADSEGARRAEGCGGTDHRTTRPSRVRSTTCRSGRQLVSGGSFTPEQVRTCLHQLGQVLNVKPFKVRAQRSYHDRRRPYGLSLGDTQRTVPGTGRGPEGGRAECQCRVGPPYRTYPSRWSASGDPGALPRRGARTLPQVGRSPARGPPPPGVGCCGQP